MKVKGGMKLEKRYVKASFVYAIMAMVFGVFYREFTKFSGFTGNTALSVMHTHYFVLGMGMFILLLLLEKNFGISQSKTMKRFCPIYHIGLNITGATFLARGVLQVLGSPLSKGLDAAISGVAGLGHILLGIGIILMLLALKKEVGK